MLDRGGRGVQISVALSRYKRAAAGSFEPGHSKRKSIWKRLLNEVKIFITLSSLQL